jgi:hypothetical protein
MAKYRKTALIDAVQFRIADKATHEHVNFGYPMVSGGYPSHPLSGRWWVKTLEGALVINDGDWIATGVKGEHWPIADDVFRATYEPAE